MDHSLKTSKVIHIMITLSQHAEAGGALQKK